MNSIGYVPNMSNLRFSIERILGKPNDNINMASVSGPFIPFNITSSSNYCLLFDQLRQIQQSSCGTTVFVPNHPKTVVKTRAGENPKEIPRRIGHPYQSRAPPKHKNLRTSFSKQQVSPSSTFIQLFFKVDLLIICQEIFYFQTFFKQEIRSFFC